MKIRFLQTTPSGVDGFPFMAGQVIEIAVPSQELLGYLDGVRAEVVRDTEPEQAVSRAPRKKERRTEQASL